MKFKHFLALIADSDGFIPTPRLRQIIHTNKRPTAREEAIAAEVIAAANPRESVTSTYPWGAEQQICLQQLWILPASQLIEWRDVPTKGARDLYSVEQTESADLPVPNAVKEPAVIRADFKQRLKEILGEDLDGLA